MFTRAFVLGNVVLAATLGLAGNALASRPNIVVIQTDDQHLSTVKAKYRDRAGRTRLVMPHTVKEIYQHGTEFSNHYAAAPLCAPSRASFLTGLYPHSSGLTGNDGVHGGWPGFRGSASYDQNVPVILQRAGYRTTHIGKFANGYYDTANDRVDTTVPPGWDNWFTTSFFAGTKYYGYEVNDNGKALGPVGDGGYRGTGRGLDSQKCSAELLVKPLHGRHCRYLTDVQSRRAVKEIRRKSTAPFYLQVDFQGPHGDVTAPQGPQPATRHIGSAARTALPRTASFNEADNSDKPGVIQMFSEEPFGQSETNGLARSYRSSIESLRSVDDGVGAIMETLRKTGKLNNTFVFFLSDNGVFLGEHRFTSGKFLPYEPAVHVPLAVRGPKVPVHASSDELSSSIDLPATFLRLTGAGTAYPLDGRSLVPFWRQPDLTSRRPVEISLALEPVTDGATISAKAPPLNFSGYRVGPYKYVVYQHGDVELYDLDRDPDETENRIDAPEYAAVRQYMETHLEAVVSCSGSGCRADLPPWPEPGS
jgi:N-acetylglucosamine-6-sulfatase